jgi:hypothetical protein
MTAEYPTEERDNDSKPAQSAEERRVELMPESTSEINDEELDEKAYDLLDTDPVALELKAKLALVRASGDRYEEEQAVGAVKSRLEQIRLSLREQLGLPDLQAQHREKLRQQFATVETTDSEDAILLKLGMVRYENGSDQGKLIFQYPEGLFTEHTNELWEGYIDMVKSHATAFDQLKREELTDPEWRAIDQRRVNAHNLFTAAMLHDLGLENNDENFTFCRRLAAKMRDELIPNTGELYTTRDKVTQLVAAIKGHEKQF